MSDGADGWEDVAVRDLASDEPNAFVDGDWIESKDQSPDGTIRLLQVGNVLRGSLKTAGTCRWVTPETVRRLGCTLLRPGDILIARMPDPIGRACIVPALPYPAITAVDCAILRPNLDLCDPLFVVHALNSDHVLSRVAALVGGTTRQRISRNNLGSITLALPPLAEQRKIAAALSTVDEVAATCASVHDQHIALDSALLRSVIERGLPGVGTATWGRMPLREFATLQRGFDLPVQDRKVGQVPVVASNGPVGLHSEARVHGPGVVTGRSGTIGKVFYYDSDFWPLNTTLYVSDFHGNDPRFVAAFLRYFHLERFVAATGVPSLNRNFVHDIEVCIPPVQTQRQIADLLVAGDQAAFACQRQLIALNSLRTQLATGVLSGAIRVPMVAGAI